MNMRPPRGGLALRVLPAVAMILALAPGIVSAADAPKPSPSATPVPVPVSLELKSPDGKLVVDFALKPIGSTHGCAVYSISYGGKPVIAESRLGLQLRDVALAGNFNLLRQKTNSADTTWKPVLGERESIRDHYNELTVDLQVQGPLWTARRVNITFRAYNEGVAFRYSLPDENNAPVVDIVKEATQFAFTGNHPAWAVNSAQADYTKSKIPLGNIPAGTERPLTVEIDEHLYASITEASIADYARTKFRVAPGAANTLEAYLDAQGSRGGIAMEGEVIGRIPFNTPWRVVLVAESPGKLLEQNYLVQNLNEPCALADTSWIKPGNVLRVGPFTTEGGKACADFAVKHKMSYLLYDAGWYGSEIDTHADARDVDPNFKGRLNLHEVIDYAKTKNIGVILYVNHLAMERQLDDLLPLYEKWGVKGVKYGFVNVGSQFWQAWNHEAIRKAAAHHLMVDIHDEFRSAGYERTYPNLMEVEGIGGDETMPTAVHNAILPFTRYLTGAADHTYCWNAKRMKNTKAHQLAITTIFYNPWASLYWYAGPATVPDEPALDYWDNLPTTWEETRVPQGEIGKRVVVARRKGEAWFVGAIAPENGKFPISLNFLPEGKKFTAKIFEDAPENPGVEGVRGVKITEQPVDSRTVLNADIPANGGLAIRIMPLAR